MHGPAPAPGCMGNDPGCLHPSRRGYCSLRRTPQNRPGLHYWAHLPGCYFLLSQSQESKNVSVKGRCESESSRARIMQGCWWQWGSLQHPWLRGTPHPGWVLQWKVASFSPGDSPQSVCLPGQSSQWDTAAWLQAGLQPCVQKMFWCFLAESCW